MRQLGHAEFDLHMTAVSDSLGILDSLPGIGEQPFHLFLALHVVLSALIAHAILVRQLFPRLQTKQNIVRIGVFCISIMHIVGGHQGDIQFSAHLQENGIYLPLFRQAMVLKFQKEVTLSEAILILSGSLLSLVKESFHNITLHFSRKAGGQCDDALVVPVQHLHVHPWLIIIAFRKAAADNFRQIGISYIVFRKQYQMVVPVLSAGQFFVKAGIWRYIDLAA